jgi:hypothetical protein
VKSSLWITEFLGFVQHNISETGSVFVGFEVLTAVVMKSTIFWDITPCSVLSVYVHFGGTYRDPEDGGDMFLRNFV